MNKAIVFDIDNVLLDSKFIIQEIFDSKLKGSEKWDYFYAHCNDEKISANPSFLFLINELIDRTNITIFLSTARREECRKETEQKLLDVGFDFFYMYMRNPNDFRPAPEVKLDHLQEIQKSYDILFFIDDDLNNCEMAKKLGITALRKI